MEPTPAEISTLLDAFNSGRMAEAEQCAMAMTQAYPGVGLGWRALGTILARQGRAREALAPLQRSAEFFPDDAETHNNLGAVLQRLDRFAEAEAHFRRAVGLKPGYAEAHNNLGTAVMRQGRPTEAEASFREAILLNPVYADAYGNLGILLRALHRSTEAEAAFRKAVSLNPNNAKMHQNLIFAMDFMEFDAAALQAERKRWAQRFAPARPRDIPFANSPDPERRLRIGYVSADMQFHSAVMFFGAMLVAFDPGKFEVFAYSNSKVSDDVTVSFQRSVTCWRPIAGLSDDAVESLIRADAIDILVDLSGHTAGNRLQVFARKPAPILVTAWGYLTGTGLDAIDVIFSDAVLIPEHERTFYAERQVRYLPNAVCRFWPRVLPNVTGLPAQTAGALTFGSLNRVDKASDAVFELWGRVLQAVPGSRFLMKTAELGDPQAKAHVLRKFAAAGVGPERITLMGKTSWVDHMLALGEIDITLDTFPQSGGVTTLESLGMGVPVVTLAWPTIGGRMSATILTAVGMGDWIAGTPDAYVDIAVRKAGNLRELAETRLGLRGRVDASIIGRQGDYVAAVEREYRTLWREWCARQTPRT